MSEPLDKFDAIYKDLVNHIDKFDFEEDAEIVLKWIGFTADFAQNSHTGRFADGRIENIALEIGRKLDYLISKENDGNEIPNIPHFSKLSKRHVLHIATTVCKTGGHTRLINNWMRNDVDSIHSLVLINQITDLPDWLVQIVQRNGGNLIILPPSTPLLLKAKALRQVSRSNVDMIILHHHPNDVVPIVAFAIEELPPVAIMNHGDHVFWLGSTVADVIIDFRDYGKKLSEKRRFAKETLFLPIPLNDNKPALNRAEARKRLNIPDRVVMLLSIGASYKYYPMNDHNFFETSVKLLEQNKDAHLYVIGVDSDENREFLRKVKHKRLHLLGTIEDTVLYQIASDLYLDGFPYGGGTTILEASFFGICPILQFAPIASYMYLEDISLQDTIHCAENKNEYIKQVNDLIRSSDKRESIGKEVRNKVLLHHTGHEWQNYLDKIYIFLYKVGHQPGTIPNSSKYLAEHDSVLSKFCEVQWGGVSKRKETIAHFAARQADSYDGLARYKLALQSTLFARNMAPGIVSFLRVIVCIIKLLLGVRGSELLKNLLSPREKTIRVNGE
jgi:hypothetical protein